MMMMVVAMMMIYADASIFHMNKTIFLSAVLNSFLNVCLYLLTLCSYTVRSYFALNNSVANFICKVSLIFH
jgi:hypothetical protein